jgi:hypothetical protein
MTDDDRFDSWPGSHLNQLMLAVSIGKFLRTHQNGGARILEWLDSVPPDRTEEEYAALRKQADEEQEAHLLRILDAANRQRAARGEPPFNRRFEVELARNLKQSAAAQADHDAIAKVMRSSKREFTAKEMLRILGWPITKLRAVRRHMAKIRSQ